MNFLCNFYMAHLIDYVHFALGLEIKIHWI